ncbi:NAD(P)-dependent oxidoreductase [Parachlamydia acanthamoebae]|uniref:Putative oxidoreductase YfjR n=1 Tax=Parachlamydia acanthamoebae TaxID=83552 RepID=A0A0C1C505_9BACT|nr:NAD(P)-dependent oxidoreductase [Parachlamydia acanthamoebae]KIA76310.1 putative oxidoreductase YfjR [Parachlamydia acanthamoebae]
MRKTMSKNIAFIGLGNMGFPLAENLLKAGFPLWVYNRTAERAKPLLNQGAHLLDSPKEAFEKSSILISMLSNDQALEEIVEGEKGILKTIRTGCVHVSMSTISPETADKMAALHAEKGAAFVCAPVFGRPDAAAVQKLWICIAGDPHAKVLVRPILEKLGQGVADFGAKPSHACLVKISGNFLILSAIEAMGESFALLKKSGIDIHAAAALYTQSILACPVYQNYSKIIVDQAFEDAGFKMTLGLKDVNLVLNEAEKKSVPLPLASLLHNRLMTGLAKQRQNLDWSAITLQAFEDAALED